MLLRIKSIKCELCNAILDLSSTANTEDFWKKEYKKLENEMQQKDEELKKLRSQVENVKLKDEEIKKLQVQLEGLTSCITKFQNNVKSYTLHGLPEKLSKVCHPDSQRSSLYKDSDSQRSSWYRDSDSPSWYPENGSFPAEVSETILNAVPKSIQHDDEDVSSSTTLTPENNSVLCYNRTSGSLATQSGASALAVHHPLTSSHKTSDTEISTMDQMSTAPSLDQDLQATFKNNEMPETISALEQKRQTKK